MTSLFGRDPVALKELRGVSRRWQTYVGRCLYVGITAALLYQYWKENWVLAPGESATMSVSQYAVLGRAIFERCYGVSLVLTVLAALLSGSEMLARELKAGTLGLLLLTPLTPGSVVLGKWKGAMMIAGALYLCSVPVLAIAVYLGGVGPEDLAHSAVFTLGLAASAAAIALYASARFKSAGAAVAASIPLLIGVLLLFLAAEFAAWLNSGPSAHQPPQMVLISLIAGMTTVIALRAAVRQVGIRTGAIPGKDVHDRELRTLALDELREQRGTKPQRILLRWRSVWEGSPLLWKEFTLRPALRIREDWRSRSYVFLYFSFLVSWVLTAFGRGPFFPLWGCFFAIVAISGGCLLFAPEKEGRQWMLLLSTPVTPVEIVQAKLLCGLIFPEALGLIVLYAFALCVWLGGRPMDVVAGMGFCATTFLLFCYILSAAASLRVRTARTAFLITAGIVAFLVTMPSLFSAAFRPMGATPWAELWNWIEALDPVLVFNRFDGVSGRKGMSDAVGSLFRFIAIYLPVTLLLPVEMVVRFRKIALNA